MKTQTRFQKIGIIISAILLMVSLFSVYASINIPLGFNNVIQYIQSIVITDNGGSGSVEIFSVNKGGSHKISINTGLLSYEKTGGTEIMGFDANGNMIKTESKLLDDVKEGTTPVKLNGKFVSSPVNVQTGDENISNSLITGFIFVSKCNGCYFFDSVLYSGYIYFGSTNGKVKYRDGSDWQQLGASLGNYISSMINFNNMLYIGLENGEVKYRDGSDWQQLGASLGDHVYSMINFNNVLYIGLGNGEVRYRDGSDWQQLGASLGDHVFSMINFNNVLYIGLGNGEVKYRDGSDWQQLGASLGSLIRSMVEYNGKLYVGLTKKGYNGLIIKYRDGSSWQQLGSFLGGQFSSMIEYNGKLYVGLTNGNITYLDGNDFILIDRNTGVIKFIIYNGKLYSFFVNGSSFFLRKYDNFVRKTVFTGEQKISFTGTVEVDSLKLKNWNSMPQCNVERFGNMILYGGNVYICSSKNGRVGL